MWEGCGLVWAQNQFEKWTIGRKKKKTPIILAHFNKIDRPII